MNPYRFNSKRFNGATNTYDMGFREYNPGLNRFLSRDMYNGALKDLALGTDPWTVNRYAFAGGNPITGIEFDGHCPMADEGGCDGGASYSGPVQTSVDSGSTPPVPTNESQHINQSLGLPANATEEQQAIRISQTGINPAIAGLNLGAIEFNKTGLPDAMETVADVTGIKDASDCAGQLDPTACVWTALLLIPLDRPVVVGVKVAVRPAAAVGEKAAAKGGASVARFCGNSFTGDTVVLMADGTKKPIKDVKLGDMVMATDPDTGESGPRTVIDLIRHGGAHTMVAVQLADGSTIDATDHHPFWVPDRGHWVDAINLKAGDQVLTSDNQRITVLEVGIRAEDLIAYNLTVKGLHTYYVGPAGVLVHNSGCDEWAEAFAKRAGGDVRTFESPLGRNNGWLGPYRPGGPGTKAVEENWGHHTVVVRDGQVFDQWHPNGVGIVDFKRMFDYSDAINFGF